MQKIQCSHKGKNYEILVDDEDWKRIAGFKLRLQYHPEERRRLFVIMKLPNCIKRLHRFILNVPKEILVDFKDQNTLNCQKSNLVQYYPKDKYKHIRQNYPRKELKIRLYAQKGLAYYENG